MLEFLSYTILSKNIINYNNKFLTVDSSSRIDFSNARFPSVLNIFLEVPAALYRERSTLARSSLVVVVFIADVKIRKQLAAHPRVLGGDEVGVLQYFDGSRRKVA